MQRMDEKLDKKRQDIEDKEAELDSCSKKVSGPCLRLIKTTKGNKRGNRNKRGNWNKRGIWSRK